MTDFESLDGITKLEHTKLFWTACMKYIDRLLLLYYKTTVYMHRFGIYWNYSMRSLTLTFNNMLVTLNKRKCLLVFPVFRASLPSVSASTKPKTHKLQKVNDSLRLQVEKNTSCQPA